MTTTTTTATTMTTKTSSIPFATLPALGAPLENGTFAGITTRADGTHCAVVLLPDQGEKLTWKKAMNWAAKLGAELPSRPVASMLFANVKAQLKPNWNWTNEPDDASYAWYCHFGNGGIYGNRKSYEGSAVAVRLIPLTA
jgi:hypothetical protein